jgi:NADPH2:quinone reductase
MKAVALTRYLPIDDPQSLVDVELPRPDPRGRDILVRVEAVSVNPVDTKLRAPKAQVESQPKVLGYDAAGVVEAVGDAVTHLRVGDAVYYAGDVTRQGSNAQYQLVDERLVARKPATLDFAAAAALPLTAITAWELLFQRMPFDADDGGAGKSLLVIGGAGGVGSAALQLLRGTGIRVISTAGSAAKCDWMRAQGVEHAINYNDEDVGEAVEQATGGRGVDCVLDPIGGRSLAQSVSMCAPLGRVVSFGVSSLNPGKTRSLLAVAREGLPMRFFNLLPLFDRNVGVHPINMLHLAESEPSLIQSKMTELLALVASRELTPVLAQQLPLSAAGAREAHHYLQDRKNIGKVVLVRA